jgi:hypothetical protein
MLTEGVWAEVLVGKEHLRLFSEKNAQGTQASVYNVNTKNWIAPSEAVEDIDQGKDKTTEYARIYLRHVTDSELPPLEWKTSRSR